MEVRFEPEDEKAQDAEKPGSGGDAAPRPGFVGLSEVEQAQLRQLKTRDREVRSHEQAHRAVGGGFVRGGARYSYQSGPDGRQYAVAGEVNIDTSPVPGDPEATIRKAQTVRRAALAPVNPSPQDRLVAAMASRMESQARTELARLKEEERAEKADEKSETQSSLAPEPFPFDSNAPTNHIYQNFAIFSNKAVTPADSSGNGSYINTYL
ncbi:MAG: hypothetical protein JRD68_09300 [Deltaproteobacteria bacterium]|nr:hypothetical protein [Deltaproteobacteria bacterium]